MIDIISADSVELLIDSIATARRAAEVTLFGEESQLSGGVMPIFEVHGGNVEGVVANPTYVILALAFLLLYMVWLPHIFKNGGIRWSILKRTNVDSERDLIGKQRLGMIVATWALSITLFAMFTARIVAQFSPFDISFDGAWWILGGVISVVTVALYGWVVLKAVGYLIIDMEFARKLQTIKRQQLIFCVIFLSPLFITSSLSNYIQGQLVVQLSLLVVVALVINYLRQSFLLFMRQNFSILHWILYLCGVEILPLTFIWAITIRYLGV
ncbi:MAG: DUF4271 domain-containing protein [Rikenellaceae bacterium]